jgi:hypothetical protein
VGGAIGRASRGAGLGVAPRSSPGTSPAHGCAGGPRSDATSIEIALIYELLDAHDDTAQMTSALEFDPSWELHLEYLRALQRKGREVVARLSHEVHV